MLASLFLLSFVWILQAVAKSLTIYTYEETYKYESSEPFSLNQPNQRDPRQHRKVLLIVRKNSTTGSKAGALEYNGNFFKCSFTVESGSCKPVVFGQLDYGRYPIIYFDEYTVPCLLQSCLNKFIDFGEIRFNDLLVSVPTSSWLGLPAVGHVEIFLNRQIFPFFLDNPIVVKGNPIPRSFFGFSVVSFIDLNEDYVDGE
ncbi:hypothetical protein RF11_09922 [Thelohanellus kitauei]|uniref:Uncharacterized protein n=1 Tax=Thelohanellus kitauei TaxID=669202 RepID=A0A0C2MPB6_THEKT|nr:hypothetical protein RF11_09922 [Thelohanellus kitauei]